MLEQVVRVICSNSTKHHLANSNDSNHDDREESASKAHEAEHVKQLQILICIGSRRVLCRGIEQDSFAFFTLAEYKQKSGEGMVHR